MLIMNYKKIKFSFYDKRNTFSTDKFTGYFFFSFRSIIRPHTHGFARFFGWEIMIWIYLSVKTFWFVKIFSFHQIVSWILLAISVFFALKGFVNLLLKGKPSKERSEKHLFNFEKTTELVETGIYKYIRHPLYASLIYMRWGMTLKNPTFMLIILTITATWLFYITAKKDEKECVEYFGEKYSKYMNHSKMFIPYVL